MTGFWSTYFVILTVVASAVGIYMFIESRNHPLLKQRGVVIGVFIVIIILMMPVASVFANLASSSGGNNPSSSPTSGSTVQNGTTNTPTLAQPTQPTQIPTSLSQPVAVLYQADWSNGLDGWSGSSDWKVSNGMLISDGSYNEPYNYNSPTIESPYQVNGTSDYAVEVRIQELGAPGCFDAVTIRGSTASDGVQGYRLAIECFGGATIYAAHGGSLNQIAHVDFDPGNTWHIYRLEAKGTSISAFIDGIQILEANDATFLSGGIMGIKSQATQILVSSFKVIAI